MAVWYYRGVVFSFVCVSAFLLEFAKDARVYWGSLSANQWVLIGIFAECIGVLYVRGGGRETLRPISVRLLKFSRKRKEEVAMNSFPAETLAGYQTPS